MILEIQIAGAKRRVEISQRGGKFFVKLGSDSEEPLDAIFPEAGIVQFIRNGTSDEIRVEPLREADTLSLDHRGKKIEVAVRDPRTLRSRRAGAAGETGPQKITAPMPGKVVRILAPAGAQVEAGDGVIVIEAMKMQNELKSPKAGKVQKITVAQGATVNPGDTLAIIE